MQTSALNAPSSSVPTIAMRQITALWIGFWLAPMKKIPPLTSAPTVSPSAESKNPIEIYAAAVAAALFIDFFPVFGIIMIYNT